jgi:hypothetical protein
MIEKTADWLTMRSSSDGGLKNSGTPSPPSFRYWSKRSSVSAASSKISAVKRLPGILGQGENQFLQIAHLDLTTAFHGTAFEVFAGVNC